MRRIAFIRAAPLTHARNQLIRMGADVGLGLARAQIPSRALDDPETPVPYGVLTRFLQEMARIEGRETLGAELGLATPLEALGVFGRSIAHTETLGDAIAAAQRLAPAYFSGELFWMRLIGDDVALCHRFPTRVDEWHHQAEQFSFGLVLRLVRALAAPHWRPTIHMKKGIPPAIAELPPLRNAEITFGHSAWAILVPRSLLRRAMPAPSTLPPTPAEMVRWKASAPSTTYIEGVEHVVRTLVTCADGVGIDQVAAWIRTSTRTLQRRLEDAGLTYAKVLSKVQFETAVRLLDDRALGLGAVALALGYSDPAHFTRAVRRWTGVTPRAFRRLRTNEMALLTR